MAVRPVIIRDENTLVGLLRARRQDLDISQQELDDRIGTADGYVAKLEAPTRAYGRRAAWGIAQTMTWWLEALGLTLVVMDKAQAEALIAASDEPDMTESAHMPYAGRNRRREIVQRRVFRTGFSLPSRAA